MRALDSSALTPATDAALQALRNLHPAARHPLPAWIKAYVPPKPLHIPLIACMRRSFGFLARGSVRKVV